MELWQDGGELYDILLWTSDGIDEAGEGRKDRVVFQQDEVRSLWKSVHLRLYSVYIAKSRRV